MTLYIDDSFHSRAALFIRSYAENRKLNTTNMMLPDCTIPAVLDDNGLVISGLCHVTRQIIKHSITKTDCCEEKKLRSLLV